MVPTHSGVPCGHRTEHLFTQGLIQTLDQVFKEAKNAIASAGGIFKQLFYNRIKGV
ncbi:hypothetical protein [Serratia sp. M24T3]|uniref:hypothetical protein n=1 Tax=Serratia sp. M24T3 TaxID=932213 RepID=UPI00031082A2|nr:hypothetical protein [Serratia sp. M24T3]